MSEPLFSIVIACYNHEKFIREAVESALLQPHASKEIIVVDDASSDGSVEVLSSFGPAVTVERLPVNRGAAAGRNHGAAVAKGKYLVFLDGDDALMPWTLKVYGRIIEEHRPKLILGQSSLFYGDLPAITTGAPEKIRLVEYATFFDKDRSWVYNTSSLVVERAAFQEAGGWSEDIFYQDIQDLLNKLCVAGPVDMILAPQTVLYRMHSTNAVRRIAPFIDGIHRLLEKVKRGVYPGDRRVQKKRAVWFGGLIFYWAKEGMRNGHLVDGLKLLLGNWWMVFLATSRRTVSWITGRRPVEVLMLEPNNTEDPIGSHQRAVTEHS